MASRVGGEQHVLVLVSLGGDISSARGLQEIGHPCVVREDGGGRTDFGTHVADGTHTGARDGVDTRTVVLDDGTCTSFHGKDAGDLKDNVLRRSPAGQGSRQLNADNLKINPVALHFEHEDVLRLQV